MPTASKRGRASKPVMDYSKVAATAIEEAEPLKVQRQREANPFIDNVKASVESGKAFSFGKLTNEQAANQVISLLSRAAEQLDYGMSTRKEKVGNQWKVTWQAKAERIRRPRKGSDNAESNGEASEEAAE